MKTGDEGEAMKTAYSAVKDLAEQDVLEAVQIFAAGRVSHPVGDFVVDDEFCQLMLESFDLMAERGYYPPVLQEHNSDGCVLGIVKRLFAKDGGLFADLELAAGVLEEVAQGKRRNVSPSFFDEFEDTHSGRTLSNFLREVSWVSVPHLKNLQPPQQHYTMSENGLIQRGIEMEEEKELMEEGEEEVDRMGLIEDRISKIEEWLAEQTMAEEEVNEEIDMSSRVAQLERKLAEATAINQIKSVYNLDDETTKDLAELALDKPELFKRQAKRLAESSINRRGREIGSIGDAAVGSISMGEARQRAAKAGCKPGSQTISWIQQNAPQLLQ